MQRSFCWFCHVAAQLCVTLSLSLLLLAMNGLPDTAPTKMMIVVKSLTKELSINPILATIVAIIVHGPGPYLVTDRTKAKPT